MINSAAGAVVGGYVLGVRDRHWDNILVKVQIYSFVCVCVFVLTLI